MVDRCPEPLELRIVGPLGLVGERSAQVPARQNVPAHVIVEVDEARKDYAVGIYSDSVRKVRLLIRNRSDSAVHDGDVSVPDHTLRRDDRAAKHDRRTFPCFTLKIII